MPEREPIYVTHDDFDTFRLETRSDLKSLSDELKSFTKDVMRELSRRGRIDWAAAGVALIMAGMAATLISTLNSSMVERQAEINYRLDMKAAENTKAIALLDTVMQRQMQLSDDIVQREVSLHVDRLEELIEVNKETLKDLIDSRSSCSQ